MTTTPLAELVKKIDDELEFVSYIGSGEYSIILEVRLEDTILALKINKKNEAYQIDKQFTIENEFNAMKALEGIHGIPKVFKFYKKSPCLNNPNVKGKNAYLRELIPGKLLDQSEKPRLTFFVALNTLINEMADRGYSILTDFGASNILIDNHDRPYFIDLMCAIKLSKSEKIREQQMSLVRKRLTYIQQRYS